MFSFSKKILEALAYAAEKHQLQHRKGIHHIPYINHPVEVARLISVVGGIEDAVSIQAALLHDVIEDTDTTFSDLEILFGSQVAQLVSELSDDKSLPSYVQKQQQLENAPKLSEVAKIIRIADKIANITDMTEHPIWWSKKKKLNYLQWASQVVKACFGVNKPLENLFWEKYTDYQHQLTRD